MLFEQAFLDSIDDDPTLSIVKACEVWFKILEESRDEQEFSEFEFESALETFALISTIVETHNVMAPLDTITLEGDMHSNTAQLSVYLRACYDLHISHASQRKLESYKRKYQSVLGSAFFYEFSQGDLDQIQTLINELRTEISKSDLFEKDHKNRLLKRLERLQSEMHKRISDLDKFWGLIGDAGVATGKFGNDVKPIVDRIREIADIVWRTQSRTEELPSSIQRPLLGNDDEV